MHLLTRIAATTVTLMAFAPGAALALSSPPSSATPPASGGTGSSSPAPSTGSPAAIPEPATLALMAGGIAAVAVARRRRKR